MAGNGLFRKEQQSVGAGAGGLASIYVPEGGNYSYVNITKNYPWTVSEYAKETIGRVILKEYQILESSIKRQAEFYIQGLEALGTPGGQFSSIPNENNILAPYEELYPKDKPTGFVYDMPYFSEVNFEVNTDPWISLDTLEKVGEATTTIADMFRNVPGMSNLTSASKDVIGLLGAGGMAAISFGYPKVGIMDRPRMWQSHDPRNINITFPLYNTLAPDDWKKNRLLCELLVNQNLYNKRDFITSIPPVFYEVLVLGQHYSWASCVTNISIYNRGNVRLLRNNDNSLANVPDVYEVNLTLTDMVIPSKNQFQSLQNQRVVSSVVQSQFAGAAQEITSTEGAALGGLGQAIGPLINLLRPLVR